MSKQSDSPAASASSAAARAAAARARDTPLPDLRQRVLDTARAVLDEQGVAGLSLREVARRAGVTHQAPYHHFGDRESVLAELVCQGFDELARRMEQARIATAAGPRLPALVAAGQAYVGFALDQPGVFRIMFRPDICDPERFPAALAAGQRAYDELQRLVAGLQDRADPETLAAVVWAQVQGLAELLLDGPPGRALPDAASRQAYLNAALQLFAARLLAASPPT